MDRLTIDKQVSEMNMVELAHNSCYADDKHNARYRDYDLDIDSRQLVRNLVKDICDVDMSDFSDEEVDDYMAELLSAGMDSKLGLLALFYRNIWAMADLRETLKRYEDLGTVEELEQAREKKIQKKPDIEGDGFADGTLVYDTWICPCCHKRYEIDYDNYDYCPNCGQHIDRSDLE